MTDNKYKLYSCKTGWITLNLKKKHVALYYKNKFEKLVHLIGFYYKNILC